MAEALKDQFFQRDFFEKLGSDIQEEFSPFDEPKFLDTIYTEEWEGLSLTQRMSHATRALQKCLPDNYIEALDILKRTCVHFDGFGGMIFSDFVQQFGLSYENESLDAIELFTQYGSGEFAIRPFIVQNEQKVMKRMLQWSQHDNFHVRRLSSEGCRPRLPWSMALPKFKKDPTPILPILENLKDDPELYVRKSVANNINDLAKDNPDLVLDLVKPWMKKPSENTRWIVKQGLRTLIKDGNQGALNLLGFKGDKIELTSLKGIPTSLDFGNGIEFEFTLKNTDSSTTNLMVDYIVHFQKNNGTMAPKVFKLKAISLEADESATIKKKHKFETISTRKYYPGQHKISIQVNGKILGEGSFELVM